MNRFQKSRQADEDLIAIYIQGADLFGLAQADRYLDELESIFQRLADYPGLARLRLEHQPPPRIFTYKAHVIVYDTEDDDIVIVRVRHGREDWRSDPRGSESERAP